MSPRPAVVFGGPSPEHDISILTGLQAGRALNNGGRPVDLIYWTKTGLWFSIDPDAEASHFTDGVPAKAKPLRFVAEPGGGFFSKKKAIEVTAILNACHGGPGEDGTLQALFDLAGLRTLHSWLGERDGRPSDPLFPNARGGRLSRDGVEYILRKHLSSAVQSCPSLKNKRITPHVLRHTAAMDLLQHGVDRSVIAL